MRQCQQVNAWLALQVGVVVPLVILSRLEYQARRAMWRTHLAQLRHQQLERQQQPALHGMQLLRWWLARLPHFTAIDLWLGSCLAWYAGSIAAFRG